MAKKKKNKKKKSGPRCGLCGGTLVPSECGCDNEECTNYVGKWPRPGTFYSPAR